MLNDFDIDAINLELETLRRDEIDAYIAQLDIGMIADLEDHYGAIA